MIKIPEIRLISCGKRVCLAGTEFEQYADNTDESIFKAYNTNFEVTLNESPCSVRECRVSAMPFNRPWPGYQRAYNQTESAGYISFSADEPVNVKVKSVKPFNSALIRPKSKNITTEISDGQVSFTLTSPGSYVLELGGEHNVLHIFFNPIKKYEQAKNATYNFGPGMHFPGIIYLRDNDTVYIDENAIVFGSVYSEGAKNVKIFGGGIIDNSCEERITENCYENHTKGTFRIYNCENIDISDIILTNSSTWALALFNCKNINIDNIKIVGHWRYNTDGIDIVNSDNISIKNSFIRTFDDGITIKAIYDHPKPIENITVDNCVVWCGWGQTCEVGIESAGKEYRNIVFSNCDLIHNSHTAMCIANGCYADMHDILFENINVELQHEMASVVQHKGCSCYNPDKKTELPVLVRVTNTPYSIRRAAADGNIRETGSSLGNVHDVVYRNINVITERADIKPIIIIESCSSDVVFNNFSFENICINSKKEVDFEHFCTQFANAENINIK